MRKIIIFDLDGTLTESGEGIVKSVQYALTKMGMQPPEPESLHCFIGPPLVEQFMSYAAFNRNEAERALKFYRERFAEIGIFENRLYNGIPDMLKALKAAGNTLVIASSKPEVYVERIVEHFDIAQYFTVVVGATMDEKRSTKEQVILEALSRLEIKKEDKTVMVGDKSHDVLGARRFRIPCVAVSYGYGTAEELNEVQPDITVDSVKRLKDVLLNDF